MPQMISHGVRTLLLVVAALLGGVLAVKAQPSEPHSTSMERLRVALQSPQSPINSDGVPHFAPSKPDEFRLGAWTFLKPDTPGQFVSLSVPVGALARRAAHSIAAAQYRRAENAARDEVAKALAEFQNAQRK
jgi:hypothetical protein